MNLDQITPTASVALADRVRQLERSGKSIIKLQTGDPDFATHPEIVEAAFKAMRDGHTHYSESIGLPLLRRLLADELSRESFAALDERNILITTGAAGGIAAVMAALIESGDEVIVLQPAWPTVASLAVLNGASIVPVNALQDEESLLGEIKARMNSKTKLICVNTPNNPCGTVLSEKFLAGLNTIVMESEHVYLISDEVYRSIYYGVKSSCAGFLGLNSRLILADSFSKRFAMTGWRIGYVAADRDLISRISKAAQLLVTHVPSFTQIAAVSALTSEKIRLHAEEMVKEYAMRAATCSQLLTLYNSDFLKPQGAFYLFINVKGEDSLFASALLDDYNVCVVPGSAYGEAGRGYIRITYASSMTTVEEGIRVISHAIRERS
jgi:aspartate/methionine/tyrosine aminotransferase